MNLPPETSPCINRFVHDAQNALFFCFVILISLVLIKSYCLKNNLNHSNSAIINLKNFVFEKALIYLMFFYHLFFLLLHIFLNDCKETFDPFPITPNDSNSIYINAGYYFDSINIELGSNILSLILHPFVSYMKLSFLNISLFFSTLGFFGILCFFSVTKKKIYNKNLNLYYFLILLVLLPNLHYWTSSLSKDVVVFYFLSLYLFYVFTDKKNQIIKTILILSFIIVCLVRPHIGLFFIFGHGLAYIILINNFRVLSINTIVMTLILIGITFYISLYLFGRMEYTGILDIFKNLDLYFEKRFLATETRETILSDKGYLFRQMAYFFVPLELQISNFSFNQFLAFINNIVLLIIFCLLIFHIIYNYSYSIDAFKMIFKNKAKNTQKLGLLFFFLISWFALSNTTGNYGIIMRQKETIMFIMYFYLIYINSNILYLKDK